MRRVVVGCVCAWLVLMWIAPPSIASGPLVLVTYGITSTANPYSLTGTRGPFADLNGNLYVFLRDNTSSNRLGAWRSVDGGQTWSRVASADEPNGPGTGSIASYDCHQRGTTVHIVMYVDTGSGGTVYYSTFHTSDSATPDTWGTVDETVDSYSDTSYEYGVGVFAAADGDIAVVMSGEGGSSPTPPGGSGRESTMYAYRTAGTWVPHQSLVTPAADTPASGIARGIGDRFFGVGKAEFSSPGEKWQYRYFTDVGATPSLAQNANTDTLPPPSTFNYHEAHPIGVSYDAGNGVMRTYFGYLDGGGADPHYAYTSSVEDGGVAAPDVPMSATPIKSNETGLVGHVASWAWDVDAAAKTLYSVFASNIDNKLYLRKNVDAGGWGSTDEYFADADAQLPSAGVFTRNGYVYLGVIWDDGNAASSFGTTRFASMPLRPAEGGGGNLAPVVNAGPDQTVAFPSPVSLSGWASDDGLPGGGLSTNWSQLSGPGTASFLDPASPTTTASFSAPGTYVLKLSASDGELTSTDLVTVIASDSVTVEARVGASSDDAEESSSGAVSVTSSDLELVDDGGNQTVGLRFRAVAIPSGATITGAYVQFETDEVTTGAASLKIAGQASDNAGTFTSASRDVSSRPRTSQTVAWTPEPWSVLQEHGQKQRTPDLSPVIQEVVDRPGWTNGNALVLVVTGSGKRTAEAFDGSFAPLLHVEYRLGPRPNRAPTVDAGPDQSVTLGAQATLQGAVVDDGLPVPPGSVTTSWSQVSGPATASFLDPASPTTSASFDGAGQYVLELSASDGELAASDLVAVTVSDSVTVEVPIATGADDVEEKANGGITTSSSDLDLLTDGSNAQRAVGLRFRSVGVSQGATIVNAFVQFQADEVTSDPTTLIVQGQAADDAPVFSTQKYNVTSRPRTVASVSWKPSAWSLVGARGVEQRVGVGPVIQEIVDRSGWASSHALVLIFTGSGRRVAEAFEGPGPPILHIEYR